jgi:hypothetical protein
MAGIIELEPIDNSEESFAHGQDRVYAPIGDDSVKHSCRFALWIALAGLILGGFECNAAPALAAENGSDLETMRDIPLPAGAKQRVLYVRPASPRGTIVMLPGGSGEAGMDEEGSVSHGNNFVVRTRALWAAQGYATVIPDALDGQNLRGLRSSPAYAQAVAAMVSFAHGETPGPVFLLGTSQGSIAAMNGAAHPLGGSVAGVVLTESVSRESKSGETVFDASPGQVSVPALIVANRDSACRVAPAEDAPRIAAAMKQAPEVNIIYVQGGLTRSRPCGSLSPHGYLGIEPEIVAKIVTWLNAHR